jgi:hypothetical protein
MNKGFVALIAVIALVAMACGANSPQPNDEAATSPTTVPASETATALASDATDQAHNSLSTGIDYQYLCAIGE